MAFLADGNAGQQDLVCLLAGARRGVAAFTRTASVDMRLVIEDTM